MKHVIPILFVFLFAACAPIPGQDQEERTSTSVAADGTCGSLATCRVCVRTGNGQWGFCSNQCENTQTDRYNCGGCGITCQAGDSCVAGTCEWCPPGGGACLTGCTDADGDGWPIMSSACAWSSTWDCNDHDPTIYPGAPETICDEVDRSCAGALQSDPCSYGLSACGLAPSHPMADYCAATGRVQGIGGPTFANYYPRCIVWRDSTTTDLFQYRGPNAGGYFPPLMGTRECEACGLMPQPDGTQEWRCWCWTSDHDLHICTW